MVTFNEKLKRLHIRLNELAPFVIAFSAGKDSAFLAREAIRAIGQARCTLVFIDSPLVAEYDRQRLAYFQKRLRASVETLKVDPFGGKRFVRNDTDRCYHCKRFLFRSLIDWMEINKKIRRLLDGSTASDIGSYRPGARAAAELGVVSPLQELGFTSSEIAESLKSWNVPVAFLCSSSCMATRVPYGRQLDEGLLRRIEIVESFWHERRLHDVRCRAVADGCRLEVPKNRAGMVLRYRDAALKKARSAGFAWMALDLDPVRSGPWDVRS